MALPSLLRRWLLSNAGEAGRAIDIPTAVVFRPSGVFTKRASPVRHANLVTYQLGSKEQHPHPLLIPQVMSSRLLL